MHFDNYQVYPILFYDKKNSVIGAAHAGWRGTLNMIASNTIKKIIRYHTLNNACKQNDNY